MSNQSVDIRSAFVARPGYFLLDPDYSQIEFKISAALAGEKRVLDGFAKGHDYYTIVFNGMFSTNFTGKKDPVTGKRDIPSEDRKLGKETALGQNYGQEANGLARKLKVSQDRGRELMDRYWAGLPATKVAKEQALRFAMQKGYVQTWFGRKRPLPDLNSEIRSIRAKAVRSVWNTIIQGTAADWLKIAMVRVHRALKDYDAHILLTVHDELLIEVSEKEPIREVVAVVKEAMEFKVKGMPVGLEDMYPDGFFVEVGDECGYDWGNLLPLRQFIIQHESRLNLTPVRPDLKPKFMPDKAPIEVPVIAARKNNVMGEPTLDDGIHPLDTVLALVKGGLMPVPVVKQQVFPIMKDRMQGDMPAFDSTLAPPAEEEIKVDGVMTQSVDDALRSIPPPPTGRVMPPAVTPPPQDPIPPVPVLELPTNPEIALRVHMKTNNDKDFRYPAALVKLGDALNQKQMQFLKVLVGKFPGKYNVYLDFQGKCLLLEGKQIDPGANFQAFLKRGVPAAAVEVLGQ